MRERSDIAKRPHDGVATGSHRRSLRALNGSWKHHAVDGGFKDVVRVALEEVADVDDWVGEDELGAKLERERELTDGIRHWTSRNERASLVLHFKKIGRAHV